MLDAERGLPGVGSPLVLPGAGSADDDERPLPGAIDIVRRCERCKQRRRCFCKQEENQENQRKKKRKREDLV